MNARNFNKLCITLSFGFYNILFFSCDKCFCTTPTHPQCVCSVTVPHLVLRWAAIKRHLPSPLCPLPQLHIYTCRCLHSRAFSLSLFFTGYQNGDASFCGLFIRFFTECFCACSHAAPYTWNYLNTFTKPFHCFLSDPPLKHSLPMMYVKILTISVRVL